MSHEATLHILNDDTLELRGLSAEEPAHVGLLEALQQQASHVRLRQDAHTRIRPVHR